MLIAVFTALLLIAFVSKNFVVCFNRSRKKHVLVLRLEDLRQDIRRTRLSVRMLQDKKNVDREYRRSKLEDLISDNIYEIKLYSKYVSLLIKHIMIKFKDLIKINIFLEKINYVKNKEEDFNVQYQF